MGTVSGYVGSALSDVQSKYSTYSSRYSSYISALASHSLIRFTANNTPTGVYTASQLNYAVNTSGVDSGYYHSSASSPSGSDHAVRRKRMYKHWESQPLGYGSYYWNTVALEEKYECKGNGIFRRPCKVKFSSAYDAWSSHRTVCGIDRYTYSSGDSTPFDDSVRPCWTAYYTCQRSTCPDAGYHVDDGDDSSTENQSVSSTPTPPLTDNTPNCSDCTSHCSSPCSCSTSGTCDGTVVDYTPNCSYCTEGCSGCGVATYLFSCGNHRGPWSEEADHKGYGCSQCGGTFYACDSDASDHSSSSSCSKCSTLYYNCQTPGACSEGGTCTP